MHAVHCPAHIPPHAPPMLTLLAPRADELEALQECTIGLGAGDQKEMLTRMLSKIAALEAAVAAAEARRRQLHNQLVELKGNVIAGAAVELRGWAQPAGWRAQGRVVGARGVHAQSSGLRRCGTAGAGRLGGHGS